MQFHVAIIGTRGIPARYGGFETFAEELSTHLSALGHKVTVYGRTYFGDSKREATPLNNISVKRRFAFTFPHKYLDTPIAAVTSFLDLYLLFFNLWRSPYDAIILCNAANAPFSFLSKPFRSKLLINVDGIERHRAKWNTLGRLWYALGERCAVLFADAVVTDAAVISKYYEDRYKITSHMITYGGTVKRVLPGVTLEELKVTPRDYILYVSRLEPENNALGVLKAYQIAKLEVPLVIVGDAPYAKEYKDELFLLRDLINESKINNHRVIMAGYRFTESYQELQSHAKLYIQATEVGGTHPALVESMAYGNAIIANDVPEHREVLLHAGLYYEKNDFHDLAKKMKKLCDDEALLEELRQSAQSEAKARFSWEGVTLQYENLIIELLTTKK